MALTRRQALVVACNFRRLMARDSLTYDDVVEASGLDQRTIRGIALGNKKPHARTLHQLADGLGVTADELFIDAATISSAGFDEATNPVVRRVVHDHPHECNDWSAADFAELYSRFGHGGELTEEGVLQVIDRMNHHRDVLRRARIVLESGDAGLLADFVELLYQRIQTRR